MPGLRTLCKLYGRVRATDASGTTVEYVWDYAADEPVLKADMPDGSERWRASERARWAAVRQALGAGKTKRNPDDPPF